MIVDDEPHILELVKAILEQEGYIAITAESGQEALEKLETVAPDLILLDMMMPGISGREVCERIRKNPKTANLKVAFLTVAQFSEVGKNVLRDLKVLDYIAKPFTNTELVKRVKVLIA